MGEVTVNGEKAHYSQFLDHLTSYPIISNSIATFKGNKYGAKSLHYADQGYTRLAKPVLPYLSMPYSYVSPYLIRADTLGDKGLSQIDTRFPIIKEDTDKLRTTIYEGAQGSVRIVVDVKGHLVELYGTEYKKCGGDGLVASGKAFITTGLILSQESLAYVSSLLQTKKEQDKDAVQEKDNPYLDVSPFPSSQQDSSRWLRSRHTYASSPAGLSTQQPRRRRHETEITQADSESIADSSDDSEDDENGAIHAPSSTDVMVKKLVRLALASEYSRQVIRRTDISAKVLGEQGARQFKAVFQGAQKALQERFGMQMVELPGKEKVTISQRRAAQKTEKPSSSNKSWILNNTLPSHYRTPQILPPTKAPMESTYTGIYSFIIAVILLNGGALQESKLERYLKRTNADTHTPIDRTDKLLQRLCKEGYLIRNREMDGGEEIIEYMVGPRGKMEVGIQGVAGLAREVYGRAAETEDMTALERDRMEEFEQRLARSLGMRRSERTAEVENENEEEDQGGRR
ncbi:MAGE-domain-containing protein [Aspergillus ruber CBS 135680]|uniref:MAGE-domain-containing protein n=1 Tax=Aspergillus ruber (strain CBS 135680) TaxID=1388766 RepID=A0A017SSV6_ASPRC|nr:MAGE-domain-containing protein [Aspergillus ruber CBS 135680]EYE99375.1 MAGE-domain-containing protein [Aspergillus ruber CBS 135680]